MDKELILKTIDQDIALCHALASHWQAMATTGMAKNRKMFHGTKGPEFTDEEKIEDAMATSLRHINRADVLINKKKSLLAKKIETLETEEEIKKRVARISGPARM